jgi:hypothetical protein
VDILHGSTSSICFVDLLHGSVSCIRSVNLLRESVSRIHYTNLLRGFVLHIALRIYKEFIGYIFKVCPARFRLKMFLRYDCIAKS